MDTELRESLERFLAGNLRVTGLAEEVESYDIWNGRQDCDSQLVALRDVVGKLELYTTEVLEGIRSPKELQELAYAMLKSDRAATIKLAYPI